MPERRGAGSPTGLVGAILLIGGLVVRSFPAGPGGSSSIEQHVEWFQSREVLIQLSVSWVLATIGAILLLWGLAEIRTRLDTQEGNAASVFYATAIASVLLLLLGFTVAEALPAAGFFDAFTVDSSTAQTLLLMAGGVYILTVQAAWFGATAVLIGSIRLRRLDASPGWLTGLGIVMGVVGFAISPFSESGAAAVPMLWMALVMGNHLSRRRTTR